jgi:RHH-type rel operon transcriptional repressor/antitoxin RelB
MLAIQLPPELEERLDRLARATGRSKSDHAREAIAEYIGDLEDAQLAEQRLQDLRAGRSETIPLEDVMKRYGMAD